MTVRIIAFAVFSLGFYAKAGLPKAVSGSSLTTAQTVTVPVQSPDKKGLVVVFLSAKCPCSASHTEVLKRLVSKYKDFRFVGVHSNADETKAESAAYFKSAAFPFEVVQDQKAALADAFQAYKTPHVFVVGGKSEILYQGGVTNSSHGGKADRIYLEEALDDIAAGKDVRTPEGRTLGCVILRENEIYAK